MIIWRCDNCGTEATAHKIAGNEFGYDKAGFATLGNPVLGVHDVCKTCHKASAKAHATAADQHWKDLATRQAAAVAARASEDCSTANTSAINV